MGITASRVADARKGGGVHVLTWQMDGPGDRQTMDARQADRA
jgi:hypothetical protein